MTLKEISRYYEVSADLLRERLMLLRRELEAARDPEQIWNLQRRISELTP